MVIKAVPVSVDRELTLALKTLFRSYLTFHEVDRLKISRIRSLIEQLQKIDRIEADVATADFETFFVNYEGAKRAVRNIAALGAKNKAALTEFRIEANFLNATSALGLSAKAITSPEDYSLGKIFMACVSIGAFQTAVDGIEFANKEQRVITNDGCIPIARKAASVLKRLGVSDAEVAACIDVAGAMLQERKILWLNQTPDVHVVGDTDGEPGIAMEFRLPVSAAQASDMTWEWCDKLIDADLYRAGVTFGFIGVR